MAQDIAHHDLALEALRRLDHLPRIGDIGRERLFDKHMRACLHGADGVVGMASV